MTSCPNGRQWHSLLEARVIIADWQIDDSTNRPHTAHGDLSPAEFAAEWTINEPQAAERLDHSSGPPQSS